MKFFKQIAILMLSVLLSGCPTISLSPLCGPITLCTVQLNVFEKSQLERAIFKWESTAQKDLFINDCGFNSYQIKGVNFYENPTLLGVHNEYRRDITFLRTATDSLEAIFTHELGHALHIEHNESTTSIMFVQINVNGKIQTEDLNQIPQCL